jgi:hypothetical protein
MANTLSKAFAAKSASCKETVWIEARPAATCVAFRSRAIAVIFGDRSIATIVPPSSCSHTSDTATP